MKVKHKKKEWGGEGTLHIYNLSEATDANEGQAGKRKSTVYLHASDSFR